jgi:hypothetical protein
MKNTVAYYENPSFTEKKVLQPRLQVKLLMLEHTEEEDEFIGYSNHWLRRAK